MIPARCANGQTAGNAVYYFPMAPTAGFLFCWAADTRNGTVRILVASIRERTFSLLLSECLALRSAAPLVQRAGAAAVAAVLFFIGTKRGLRRDEKQAPTNWSVRAHPRAHPVFRRPRRLHCAHLKLIFEMGRNPSGRAGDPRRCCRSGDPLSTGHGFPAPRDAHEADEYNGEGI